MPKPRSYDYADEKLSQARGTLMAPRYNGEGASFVAAFEILSRLEGDNMADLPEPASDYWAKISRLMSTSGLEDPDSRGLWDVRVEQMSYEERHEFSRNVDELAHWLSDYQATRRGA